MINNKNDNRCCQYSRKLKEKFINMWLCNKQKEKEAAKKISQFILNNRDKLTYEAGIDRAKNFTVDDSFDHNTIGNKIGGGMTGGIKKINANSDNKEYVIKQNYDPRTLKPSEKIKLEDNELFFSNWVPKAHFLRAEKIVLDDNKNLALIYEKAIKSVKNLSDELYKPSQDFSKFTLSHSHFSIKAYLSSLRHGFYHGDIHTGNILIMKDGRLKFTDYGASIKETPNSSSLLSQSELFLWEIKDNINELKDITPHDDKSYGAIEYLAEKFDNLYKDANNSLNIDIHEYRKKLITDLEELANLDLWKDKDNSTLILSKDEILKLATSYV